MQRYVLEGVWSGYVARQSRVVHREVITASKRILRLRTLHSIRYTDGTRLTLHLREADYRERVQTIDSYGSLIRECEAMPGSEVCVYDLPSVQKTASVVG